MSKTKMSHTETNPVFWLEDGSLTASEVMEVLCREQKLQEIMKHLALDRALKNMTVSPAHTEKLLNSFREQQNLQTEQAFREYLQERKLNEKLLKEKLCRPDQVVQYREERWGPRANSLYLKHKDEYDLITYSRLESGNKDVMQEVYFRLKDKEETWEAMAQQFAGGNPSANARKVSVPANTIEPPLLEKLRAAGPRVVIEPVQINNGVTVVAELEKIDASSLNEELRAAIMQKEFNNWLEEESTRMFNKLQISE